MAELQPSAIDCLRCGKPLYFLGVRDFHEGTRVGFFGDFFELFQTREELDMFACGSCGHVEFFIGGVGDELRGFKITGRVRKRRVPTGRPAGQGH
jgi:hypothetical protein